MSKSSKNISIKKNMVMNMMLSMSSFLFPIITFPYVSRVLGPEYNGKINFVASVVTYFTMFAHLGIPIYGVRACAKVRSDKKEFSKTVHELLGINIFLCVIVYIAYIVAILKVKKFSQELPLFVINGLTIMLNVIGVEWVYKALEKYTYITIRSLAFKVVGIVFMLLLVRNQSDYIIYGGISIFAASASNILNFLNLRKHVEFKKIGNYDFKRHIKPVVIFFLMSVATTIYTNLDNVMLGFIQGDVQVGYYSAAVKIKNILLSVVTSASAVLLPRASVYVEKNMMDELFRLLRKTMHFVMITSLGMAVYFIIWAREGILLVSGDKYVGAIVPMMIVMPTIVLIGMTNVLGIQMMIPIGREKKVLYSEIVGACVDLILNIIFIPIYGAAGAAFGTLIAEVAVLVVQLYFVKDLRFGIYSDIKVLRVIIALLCASGLALLIKPLYLREIVSLIYSSLIFFGIYAILLYVFKDTLVREMFGNIIKIIKRNML